MASATKNLASAVHRGLGQLLLRYPEEPLVTVLNRHGLTCLVDELGCGELDAATRQSVAGAARDYAAQALAWRVEWQGLLRNLADQDLTVILLKGAALAERLYPAWHSRMLGDLDLLVKPGQQERVTALLEGLGYRLSPALPGDLVFSQCQLRRRLSIGLVSTIDLHWALSNRNLLGRLFSWDELLGCAVPMADLPGQRLGLEHALLHACIHRTGHHRDFERMIWLLDIHLMWTQLDPGRKQRCIELAGAKGIAGLLLDALIQALRVLGSNVDPAHLDGLAGAAATEQTAIFLRDRHPALQDLSTLPDWASRARYLRQVAFPAASYMRDRYPGRSPLLLLYLRRLWGGLTRPRNPRH